MMEEDTVVIGGSPSSPIGKTLYTCNGIQKLQVIYTTYKLFKDRKGDKLKESTAFEINIHSGLTYIYENM